MRRFFYFINKQKTPPSPNGGVSYITQHFGATAYRGTLLCLYYTQPIAFCQADVLLYKNGRPKRTPEVFAVNFLSAVSGEEHLIIKGCGCALILENRNVSVLNVCNSDKSVIGSGHHFCCLVIGNFGIAAVAGENNV